MSETLREDARARVEVRLENDGHIPLARHDMCLADRGLDLRRMMGVVVEQATRTDLTARLEATRRAGELSQPVGDRLRLQPAFDARHPRGGRIEDVVLARHAQRQRCAAFSPCQGCASPVSLHAHVSNHNVGGA